MTGRIVVFGATGYTGELVSRALVERGARPILAARSRARLDQLSGELGGLETRVADVSEPDTVSSLVDTGDVLVSTVGPFVRWGEPAVRAAVSAGAHYLDSTGEPGFIRRVFDHYGPLAERSGSTLVTAFGFDWVPGNVAGALALAAAGPEAVTLDVGYFVRGAGVSGGTALSAAGAILERSFAFRDGRIRAERTGARVRTFDQDDGRRSAGVSVGGTEHFGLPSLHPTLRNVDVILGRPGTTKAIPLVTGLVAGAVRIPGVTARLRSALEGKAQGSTGGPSAERREAGSCLIMAEALDTSGMLLNRTRLRGPNPYTFTGDIMAWGAMTAAAGGLTSPGALGPVTAFGLDALVDGVNDAGLAER